MSRFLHIEAATANFRLNYSKGRWYVILINLSTEEVVLEFWPLNVLGLCEDDFYEKMHRQDRDGIIMGNAKESDELNMYWWSSVDLSRISSIKCHSVLSTQYPAKP